MRPRSQTIGTLGRAPARSSPMPVVPAPPSSSPSPERGALRRWLQSAMFDNVGLKFLSIVLAVTVFLLVSTDKAREITVRVGVSYTLPEDRVLMSNRLDDVRVTIRGSWRRLRKLDEHQIDRVNLDLRGVSSGALTISNDMVHVPSGLTVTSVTPRSVPVTFDKVIDKVVEISPVVAGRPQHGYIVAEVKPAPATVKVHGADGVLAALTAIRTHGVSVDGHSDSFVAETTVAPPDGVAAGNATVSVQVRLEEELVTRKLPGVAIMVRTAPRGDPAPPADDRSDGDASRWRITPAQVDVTLTGALLAVEKARSSLVPVVKLGTDTRPREAEVTIDGLPPGIGVKISPERVKVAPIKPPSLPPPARAP